MIKKKVTIESNNISSLSHIYNAKSISTSDVIITASAYGMKLTSFNTSVVFKKIVMMKRLQIQLMLEPIRL
ncbi:MAG: hypothetical protein L6U99_00895 [Clostridium sp.]|nr:MAG: hypothetical protein L6U99_00895 [Clostridium sp.]